MGERRNRFEVWSAGIDEALQGVGSDPWGTIDCTGLRIPTLATPDADHRYLFILASFHLPERVKATIRGWRELLTLGVPVTPGGDASPLPIELPVTNPIFRFPDGNVSWHLTRVPPTVISSLVVGPPPILPVVPNLAWRMAKGPSLLYEVGTAVTASGFYVDLTSYVPPNHGRPYGDPVAHLKVAHDVRTDWRTPNAWRSLDCEVEGPGYYVLWASVAQTAGALNLSGSSTALDKVSGGLSEWQFIAAFPPVDGPPAVQSPIYWRVGGALDVFIHDEASDTTKRTGR